MGLFHKLPNSTREPAGLEWKILRKLPIALVGSLVVPLLFVAFSAWAPHEGSAALAGKQFTSAWIVAVSLWLTAWTAIFTVAIGCAIVWIMKGPAYVADRYDLVDAEMPANDPAVEAARARDE